MTNEPANTLADRLMQFFWRTPAATVGDRCRRRVTLYLIPYLFFLYILAYLDRVNVSVAAFGMEKPLTDGGMGFDKRTLGIGAGMFFWGYWILEIPSTISVLKWGARWVFVRILVLWGLACMLIGSIGTSFGSRLFSWLPHIPEDAGLIVAIDAICNFAFGWLARLSGYDAVAPFSLLAQFFNGLPTEAVNQFYFHRFMLGFFEGGFFPSVIVYLSLWFRPQDRGKAIASFMIAIPLSNVFGAPLSHAIMDHVHWFDLPGWRWVFILQGFVPVLAGFTTIWMLPDRPQQAHWLPDDEKRWLVDELEKEHAATQTHGHWDWLPQAGVVLLFTAAYLAMNTAAYGLQMFMPMIIRSLTGSSNLDATLLTAVLFAMALIGMVVNARRSDRSGERIWHTVVPMVLFSVGLALAAAADSEGLAVVAFVMLAFVMGPGMYSWLPSYWPMPRKLLAATAAASATGFINMIGNLGGAIGPRIVGSTESFTLALYILAGMPLIAAAIIVGIGIMRKQELAAEPATLPPAPSLPPDTAATPDVPLSPQKGITD